MKLSPLQVARYQYNPKLPGMLRGGISEICVKNGGATAQDTWSEWSACPKIPCVLQNS